MRLVVNTLHVGHGTTFRQQHVKERRHGDRIQTDHEHVALTGQNAEHHTTDRTIVRCLLEQGTHWIEVSFVRVSPLRVHCCTHSADVIEFFRREREGASDVAPCDCFLCLVEDLFPGFLTPGQLSDEGHSNRVLQPGNHALDLRTQHFLAFPQPPDELVFTDASHAPSILLAVSLEVRHAQRNLDRQVEALDELVELRHSGETTAGHESDAAPERAEGVVAVFMAVVRADRHEDAALFTSHGSLEPAHDGPTESIRRRVDLELVNQVHERRSYLTQRDDVRVGGEHARREAIQLELQAALLNQYERRDAHFLTVERHALSPPGRAGGIVLHLRKASDQAIVHLAHHLLVVRLGLVAETTESQRCQDRIVHAARNRVVAEASKVVVQVELRHFCTPSISLSV